MNGRGRRRSQSGGQHRLMQVWNATHDNGWSTMVVENPNGSFAAWAAPSGQPVVGYAIEPEAHRGKVAATTALAQSTGHAECSDRCSRWARKTYPVFDWRATSNVAARRQRLVTVRG
jgi:hypothetical protein